MIAQFALRLLFGMSLIWSLMPRHQVTSGFFRIQMLLALGLSVLAGLTMGRLSGPSGGTSALLQTVGVGLCTALAVCAFLGSVMWTLERRTAGTILVFVILVGSAGASLMTGGALPGGSATNGRGITQGGTDAEKLPDVLVGVLPILSELSAGALLGGAVTGMLLGHWYLTAPTMSIAPLGRVNGYFGASALIRLVLAAAGGWLVWDHVTGLTSGLWLTLRWIAGIVGPLVAVVLVARILKFRNTQAATGVLFAAVILTFIGELTAVLLARQLGIPV